MICKMTITSVESCVKYTWNIRAADKNLHCNTDIYLRQKLRTLNQSFNTVQLSYDFSSH